MGTGRVQIDLWGRIRYPGYDAVNYFISKVEALKGGAEYRSSE